MQWKSMESFCYVSVANRILAWYQSFITSCILGNSFTVCKTKLTKF